MKKKEAELLVPQTIDVIIEYIMQILEDNEKLYSYIDFSSAKIDGNNMKTINIYVPLSNFEKHINLGITNDHSNIIYKAFLDRVITNFFTSETIGVTRFYSLRSHFDIFDGIDITNNIGSVIKINMYGIDNKISDDYNMEYKKITLKKEEKNHLVKS